MFDNKNNGYDIAQVDEYITRLQDNHRLEVQRLSEQLSQARMDIQMYKSTKERVARAVHNAVNKAEEVERLSLSKYQLELQQLRSFHAKWIAHYERLIKLYPVDKQLLQMAEFNAKMSSILGSEDFAQIKTKDTIESGSRANSFVVDGGYSQQTDAVQRKRYDISSARADYHADESVKECAIASSSFDYKEAQNPKDSLSDIMKDLGMATNTD